MVGERNGSAIGTLVVRSTHYPMLVHLPRNDGAAAPQRAHRDRPDPPASLMRSLTWDQGIEILDAVATELSSRPRKALGWETPAERLDNLLAA
ncbi:hypothetical protein ACIRU2_10125 [Streptomyces sp. NPDC101169]|uniref:hypothetical protein n=1 Tax=Streptomyces sp. NPDC101169 TaxID=3366121 RepID=UPI003800755D